MKKPNDDTLNTSRGNLFRSRGLEELEWFQNCLSDYKITVYDGLSPHRDIFSGNLLSAKKLYLLVASDSRLYNVITNIKSPMAKK